MKEVSLPTVFCPNSGCHLVKSLWNLISIRSLIILLSSSLLNRQSSKAISTSWELTPWTFSELLSNQVCTFIKWPELYLACQYGLQCPVQLQYGTTLLNVLFAIKANVIFEFPFICFTCVLTFVLWTRLPRSLCLAVGSGLTLFIYYLIFFYHTNVMTCYFHIIHSIC